MVDKVELRKWCLESRAQFTTDERVSIESEIVKQVLNLPEFKSSGSVMGFLPISTKKEFDFSKILHESARLGKEVSVPFMDKTENIVPTLYHADFEIGEKKWGVQEIMNPIYVSKSPEFIICPALAADIQGFRLGYGKGFYDRFLANRTCISIVAIPEKFVFEQIPHNERDVPVQIIVTEKRILRSGAA